MPNNCLQFLLFMYVTTSNYHINSEQNSFKNHFGKESRFKWFSKAYINLCS